MGPIGAIRDWHSKDRIASRSFDFCIGHASRCIQSSLCAIRATDLKSRTPKTSRPAEISQASDSKLGGTDLSGRPSDLPV